MGSLRAAISRLIAVIRARGFRRLLVSRVLPIVIIVPLVLQILLADIIGKDPRLFPPALRQARSLLVVTAHPDDECLFFSPSILGVLSGNSEITGGLVVLSTGNNYGLGEVRKKELQGSCEALGIDSTKCLALDIPELQDDPKVWWDEDAITSTVKKYVKKWNIDLIITFDSGGISGHINHRAVSAAISNYAATDSKAPATYVLSSVGLLRKYTLLGDLPLTAMSFTWRIIGALISRGNEQDESFDDKALLASPWISYLRTRQAFRSHDSQYSWDRNLYMLLSRQVWFNDLRRVQKEQT